jgi:hypothetical protein
MIDAPSSDDEETDDAAVSPAKESYTIEDITSTDDGEVQPHTKEDPPTD